jgi:uncharacterized protein YpmB
MFISSVQPKNETRTKASEIVKKKAWYVKADQINKAHPARYNKQNTALPPCNC